MQNYPLHWPEHQARTPEWDKKYGNFTCKSNAGWNKDITLNQATRRVLDELRKYKVDPDSIIISTNLKVRVSDGLPKSGQKTPDDTGVAVWFDLGGEQKCIPVDNYIRLEQNMAAVAATLAALRTVERHGTGLFEAVFKGFGALPNPDADEESEPWYVVLESDAYASHTLIENEYKRLRSFHHPDKGGDPKQFNRVQNAWDEYVTWSNQQ